MNSRGPAVLTSNVINEAQALFQMKATKKEGCEPLVSQNDVLFILRGLGMNPTQADVEEMVSGIEPWDEEKNADKRKKKTGKEDDKKKKEEDDEKQKNLMMLPEDVPKFSWLGFIEATEGCYRSSRRCEEVIIESLKVFDRQDQRSKVPLSYLVNILTTLGDDVLSTSEVEELQKIFGIPEDPEGDPDVDFHDFAKLIQEGQLPLPPPPPVDDEGDTSRKPSMAT
eukprot:TRINITY_DN6177_c0_g3_i2.p3 TRINITY_DN6177_c0_g3~~TRINITY_DN6177_c0_g3_i2.p3  ORF type:complete len:240 (+),score=75.59 TRINITY_DN6177_c0_g3_i2:47-721(+)